jgi:hypothetical protein
LDSDDVENLHENSNSSETSQDNEEEEDERRGSIDPEALALKWLMDDKKRRDDLENVLLKFV